MTRILPSDPVEARRLHRLRTLLREEEPSTDQVLLHVRKLSASVLRQQHVSSFRKKKLTYAGAGVLIAALSCGTALAWTNRTALKDWIASWQTGSASHATPPKLEASLDAKRSHSAQTRIAPSSAKPHDYPAFSAPGSPKGLVAPTPSVPTAAARPALSSSTQGSLTVPRHSASTSQFNKAQNSVLSTAALDGVWIQVAELMRAGRHNEARKALAPLLNQKDEETRQAATVLALQIKTHQAHGLSPLETQQIQALESQGITPSVRLAARQLMQQASRETPKKPR